ncbi:MAG: di-trans,poly-cis-decaprenylcistransferase [Candidatus Nealsonbacteria bacterium]|nr:di-trans,poly-cis-decaprenylcistransferase [Candidatus Nealsonbacteria bacterium]
MSPKIENLPRHVAIIPDGNRRWAKKRALRPWMGHQQGIKAFEKVLEKALELKIPYLTFWGSSWDNLTQRPKLEVDFLIKLYQNQFQKIAEDKRIHENKVRVGVFGRWREILPPDCQKPIEKSIEATKDYGKYFLTFLLAYDGVAEMTDCIRRIVDSAKGKTIKVSENLVKQNLWTKDLPPVDLLIRTGCENDPHLSAGFMMWDTAYSQLYFTKTFLPDFTPREFERAIEDFSRRPRRFGK